MYPGMMPILHSPGLMIPGQLGPISREAVWLISAFFTLTMSCCGTPSVMHTWWQQGAQRRLRGRSEARAEQTQEATPRIQAAVATLSSAGRALGRRSQRAAPWGAVGAEAEAGPQLQPAAAAISGISASRASRIASAAPGGGT
jgi:hypothetical protein